MINQAFGFREENGVFIWENDFLRLQYSDPRIQPHSECALKSSDDILYYYYDFKVMKRMRSSDGEAEWKVIAETETYDFPAICAFCSILDELINFQTRVDEEWEIYENDEDEKSYGRSYSVGHQFSEDCYEVKKYMYPETCSKSYSLFAGVNTCRFGAEGIRIPYINEMEMRELLKCVEEFIRYSINKENSRIKRSCLACADSIKCVNGHVYSYVMEHGAKVHNPEALEWIFQEGDTLSSVMYYVREGDLYVEKTLDRKLTIAEITDEKLRFTNGESLRFGEIIYLWGERNKEADYYGPEEIAEDFKNLLNEYEKADFLSLSDEKLYTKFSEAIKNRTAMCVEEHNLPVYVESDDRHDNINENIRRIITVIKNLITK